MKLIGLSKRVFFCRRLVETRSLCQRCQSRVNCMSSRKDIFDELCRFDSD